jgi:hypothetical protein
LRHDNHWAFAGKNCLQTTGDECFVAQSAQIADMRQLDRSGTAFREFAEGRHSGRRKYFSRRSATERGWFASPKHARGAVHRQHA